MIERQTWIATVWQGALAALWVTAIAACAYVAVNMRDVNMVLDASHRARIAAGAMSDDQRFRASGKTFAAIASTIVQRIDSDRDMSAAIVDDGGKFVAGDKAVLSDVALPVISKKSEGRLPFEGAGFSNTGPPDSVRQGQVGLQGPLLTFGFGGSMSNAGFGFGQPPPMFGGPIGSTVVRLGGGWLVFTQKASAMGALGNWYWPATAVFAILSFVTVWSVGRRTLIQSARPMARVERGLRRLVDVNNSTVEAIASDDTGLASSLVESYNAAALELAAVLRQSSELESRLRQFVADAGHELRTPLAVIMGYVQLLRQRSSVDSAMAERVFSEIEGQGQRMTLLIQKLLLLTRLESQEARDIKVLDVTEITRGVTESFGPLAGESNISMHGDAIALVKMSESELRDIVGNLIDNTIKYAPGSNVDVAVKASDGFVHVSVRDNGPGMSPELRARAFERFSRGETAGSVPGSGLGLAIVETAVQRAGGSVSLRTAVGQGTTVDMRFPAWRESSASR